MNTRFCLVALALLAIVAISGCTTQSSTQTTLTPAPESVATVAVKDCGTDIDCLIAAAQTCFPARGTHKFSTKSPPLIFDTESTFEISPPTCNIKVATKGPTTYHMTQEARQVFRNQGLTDAEIDALPARWSEQWKPIGGKNWTLSFPNGTCSFPSGPAAAAALQELKEGKISASIECVTRCINKPVGSWAVATCTGELYGS